MRPQEIRGLWLGLLSVIIFAMTLPMTRLAVGPASDPQLPPLFVTAGRAVPVEAAIQRFEPSSKVYWSCVDRGPYTERNSQP